MNYYVGTKGFEFGANDYLDKISGKRVRKAEVFERGRTFQRVHREFRSLAFGNRTVLKNSLELFKRVKQKQIRWDFVFEVSMKQRGMLAKIQLLLPSVTRDLETFLQSNSLEMPAKLRKQMDSTKIRTGHLCRWLCVGLESEREHPVESKVADAYERYVNAKRDLAKTCLRLVVKIAHQFRDSGSSLMELVQDGNVGVLIAAEKYDPNLGWTFSTYASHWIRRTIFLGLSRRDFIRVPDSKSLGANRCRLGSERLMQDRGRNVSAEELVELLLQNRFSEPLFLACCSDVVSLDQFGRTETDSPFHTATKCTLDCPVKTSLRREVQSAVANAMDCLAAREKRIMEMRFGLNGETEHSLTAIANRTGLTHQRVHQIISGLKANLRIQLAAFQ